MDDFLSLLKIIRNTPLPEFLKDKLLIGSAKYYLQVSIECCLDIANHIISSERYRSPKDYADTFSVLEEQNVFSSDLSFKLRQMAKFRNRLVHLYGEIDNTFVYQFITTDMADIEAFRKAIGDKYLKDQ
jgi:uncharacterized protein YutE (UPF0331/DUF86 family)